MNLEQMNLKEFIENNQKNIKKIPPEFMEYQKFFDFHKILWPVLEEFKVNNNEAVGIEYSLRKVIDLSNHYSHYISNKDVVEIDLKNIFNLSRCDVIKNDLKIKEIFEKEKEKKVIEYEFIEYDYNYNIEKNKLKEEYIQLEKLRNNNSTLVLRMKNISEKEIIQIDIICLLFL
jgi:hypothetical protein